VSLRARVISSFVILVGVGFYILVNWVMGEMRPRYLESVEDSLVDSAQVLAVLVASESNDTSPNVTPLREAFGRLPTQPLSAKIYDLLKTKTDVRVYVTDAKGTVVFDSQSPSDEGKDYSGWRNVALALQGQYGARTSHETDNPNYSVLHVSSQILKKDGTLLGVLTLAKPTTNINFFLANARPKIMIAGGIAAISVIVLGILVSIWITYPIRRLRDYARDVRDGREAALPKLGRSEIGDMGQAFEEMREALEGKKYVEHYVQTLTHELKSPLAAIQGAAELLDEKMPEAERSRFLENIRVETGRMRSLVDRMLELSALESRKTLKSRAPLSIERLVGDVVQRFASVSAQNKVEILADVAPDKLHGEAFLIEQALTNAVQNAFDFSSPGGTIRIRGERRNGGYRLSIEDEGPGVPDYALERVFEKFYSLPRPATGKKSTGLGLSFVREIMTLHQGQASIENLPQRGARLNLDFTSIS